MTALQWKGNWGSSEQEDGCEEWLELHGREDLEWLLGRLGQTHETSFIIIRSGEPGHSAQVTSPGKTPPYSAVPLVWCNESPPRRLQH